MGEFDLMPDKAKVLRNIAITFVVLTVLLLLFIAYTTLSHAVVVVRRHAVEREVVYKAILAEETIGQNIPSKNIPATFLETTQDVSDTFLLPGGTEATAKAGGVVTITNTTDRPQPLVETTRLLTADNILFRLKQAVRVPAKGEVTAVVEADGTDDSFLIGPSRFTIPGLSASLQNSIYATSNSAMARGGAAVRAVSEQDLENAKQTLLSRAIDAVKSADVAQVASGDLTDADFITQVIQETDSSKVGEKAAALTVSMKVKVIAAAFSKNALKERVKETAGSGVTVSDTEWHYAIDNYDPVARTAVVSGRAKVGANLDTTSSVFSPINFVGATPNEVKQFLMNFEGVDSVNVELTPYWQKHLPRLPNKIQVRFE